MSTLLLQKHLRLNSRAPNQLQNASWFIVFLINWCFNKFEHSPDLKADAFYALKDYAMQSVTIAADSSID